MTTTIGLDFGTHQTKICIETLTAQGANYEFWKFTTLNGAQTYMLPSTICINEDGTLTYGIKDDFHAQNILRYFKQKTFSDAFLNNQKDPYWRQSATYTILYLAYIIFLLEDRFGNNFTLHVGIPSDQSHIKQKQALARKLVAVAFQIVEESSKKGISTIHDFLSCKAHNLYNIVDDVFTHITLESINEYGTMVFPEAYACLKPLLKKDFISRGMSLMIDIGGGTTDISFFSIPHGANNNSNLAVYYYTSIENGLNFLRNGYAEIQKSRLVKYEKAVRDIVRSLEIKLRTALRKANPDPSLSQKFREVLSNRPLVYTGGGSTFHETFIAFKPFSDKIVISLDKWRKEALNIYQCSEINDQKLSPLLSTVYGLSHYADDDNIQEEDLSTLFAHLKTYESPAHTRREINDAAGRNDVDAYFNTSNAEKNQYLSMSIPEIPINPLFIGFVLKWHDHHSYKLENEIKVLCAHCGRICNSQRYYKTTNSKFYLCDKCEEYMLKVAIPKNSDFFIYGSPELLDNPDVPNLEQKIINNNQKQKSIIKPKRRRNIQSRLLTATQAVCASSTIVNQKQKVVKTAMETNNVQKDWREVLAEARSKFK